MQLVGVGYLANLALPRKPESLHFGFSGLEWLALTCESWKWKTSCHLSNCLAQLMTSDRFAKLGSFWSHSILCRTCTGHKCNLIDVPSSDFAFDWQRRVFTVVTYLSSGFISLNGKTMVTYSTCCSYLELLAYSTYRTYCQLEDSYLSALSWIVHTKVLIFFILRQKPILGTRTFLLFPSFKTFLT